MTKNQHLNKINSTLLGSLVCLLINFLGLSSRADTNQQSFRTNNLAEWRSYSGALVPWAYWAKPNGKAWRNIFVSYRDGSASRLSLFVECGTKKLAISDGPLDNLKYSTGLKWTSYSLQTGWGQIVRDLCGQNSPTPVFSVIDGMPIQSAKNLADTFYRMTGNLIYPSDLMPAQKVCAVDILKSVRWCTQTAENDNKFSLFVPIGNYIVYSEVEGKKTWATNSVDCSGNSISSSAGHSYWEQAVLVTEFSVSSDTSDVCPVDYYTWEHQLKFPLRVVSTDL